MEALRLDDVRAAEFLGRRYGHDITDVVYLGAGQWSTAYGFTHGGIDLVVRFGAYHEDFAKDRVASEFSSTALPVPRVTEIGEAFGAWYAITERARGRFLEELEAGAVAQVLPALLDAVDAMRRADTSGHLGFGPLGATGDGSYPTWRNYLLDVANDGPSQRTHGWRQSLARDPNAEGSFTAGVAALNETIDACPERHELIHNDLLNRNVFIEADRITGIIDWGCAMYGDSLYDIALLDFWSPWFPGVDTVDILGAARDRLAETAGFDERIRIYQVHVGLVHIGYNAFLGPTRAQEMVRVCRRTMEIVKG
jgi:hygromycin-B 4-O-kinase